MDIKDSAVLIADSHHGIYTPKLVVDGELSNTTWDWSGVDKEDIKSIQNGPDDDWYWDAWANVIDNVSITGLDGTKYFLYQNDDLWAIPEQCSEQIEDWMN